MPAQWNRERIPTRVRHAKGWGAHGIFTVTADITGHTNARLFSEVGKKTDVVIRFSAVAGELDAADAERDVRGFCVKFRTEQGHWDVLGTDTPVSFVRDRTKFSALIRAQKRHPGTSLRSPTALWDFWSMAPESLHQLTILFSDRDSPSGVRNIDGYGLHTVSFVNADGERSWVKFHFKNLQGYRHRIDQDASEASGRTRDSTQEDLYSAIQRGEFPRWRVCVQMMSSTQAEAWFELTGFDPFDPTKVWPQGDVPLLEIGEIELNRNPDNYFAEIERATFSPSNIVPGIGFSPDKMQRRIFAYAGAQRDRLVARSDGSGSGSTSDQNTDDK